MPDSSTLDLGLQTLDLKKRRPGPVSKFAQLPAELRALVNQLLDEGHTYEEVVEEMAKHSTSLNIDNVGKWFNGPYQDYLAALEWRDEPTQLSVRQLEPSPRNNPSGNGVRLDNRSALDAAVSRRRFLTRQHEAARRKHQP